MRFQDIVNLFWMFQVLVHWHVSTMSMVSQLLLFPSSFLKEQKMQEHLSSLLQSIVGKARGGVFQAQGQFMLFLAPSSRYHVRFNTSAFWKTSTLGTFCFDVCCKTVFFDYGLKISLQSDTLHIVQNMLCGSFETPIVYQFPIEIPTKLLSVIVPVKYAISKSKLS